MTAPSNPDHPLPEAQAITDEQYETERAAALHTAHAAAVAAARNWRAIHAHIQHLLQCPTDLTALPSRYDAHWWDTHRPAELPFDQADVHAAFTTLPTMATIAATAAAIYSEYARAFAPPIPPSTDTNH